MNWNPLKRSALSQQRPELDSTTQSANEQLERLVAEFDNAEHTTKTLLQSGRKLLDQVLCMGKFETKLTDQLSAANVFTNDTFMQSVIEEWHSFAFVSNSIGDEYVIGLQQKLIEPLKQLKHAFGELRAQIRLHESIQLDVIKFQRKVASYNEKEKTGTNLVKLQESKDALTASRREYARRTQILVNELSKFLTGSLEMLKPLLEGFIAAELAWVRACKRSIDIRSHITTTTSIQTQSDRLKTIEDTFKALDGLSVCSNRSL